MANCNRQQLNITCGTDVVLHDRLIFDGETFDPNLSVGITANLVTSFGKRTALSVEVVDDELLITVPWIDGTLPGYYGLEVTGSCNSKKWSTYADSLIRYTKATVPGQSEVTIESDSYDITQEVGYCYSNSPVTFAEVTVDDGYGTPSVDVTYEQRVLSMAFHNLKGDTGDKGDTGEKGDTGDSAIFDPSTGNISSMKQSMGVDENSPMSQKAVTDAINAVTDMVTDIETIDMSSLTEQNCSLGSSSWFLRSSNPIQRHVAISVEPGQIIRLTPSSLDVSVAYIGFMTSSYVPPYANNDEVPYVQDTSRVTIPTGEETTFAIPDGCAYIVLVTVDGANYAVTWEAETLTSLKPHIAHLDEEIRNFAYDEKMMVRVGTAYPLRNNYINPSSPTNWTSSTTYMCRVVPVSEYKGKTLTLVNTSGITPCRYAFLSLDSSSGRVYYANGTSLNEFFSDTASVVVPSGANFLYLYEYENGDYLSHVVFAEKSTKDIETSDSFVKVNEIDLSQISERPCSLGVGVWYRKNNTGPQAHKAIPVSEGECYRLSASGVLCYYGLMTSSYSPSTTYSNGDSSPYVYGTDRLVVKAGESAIIQIPSGCAYLIITTVDGAGLMPVCKLEGGFTYPTTNAPFKLRVASWNIGGFALGTSGTSTMTHEEYPEMRQKWAQAINDINADILCMSEYNINMVNAEGDLPAIKARSAVFSPYPYAYEGNDYNYVCMAIMSNCRVNNVNEAYYLNTVVPNRYFQYGYINVGNEKVVIAATHLDTNGHGAEAEVARGQQMQELIETFADYPYVIICADWNVHSPSEYDTFANAGYKMANHGNLGDFPTYPAGESPYQYLDNIVCKGFAINGIKVVNDNTLSDHCCVYADLTLVR